MEGVQPDQHELEGQSGLIKKHVEILSYWFGQAQILERL